MEANPYLKPLKGFNPKKDLKVDETYYYTQESEDGDPLSDLKREPVTQTEQAGQEFGNFKTSGPVQAGLQHIRYEDEDYIFATNYKGVLYSLQITNDGFRPVSKWQVNRPVSETPGLGAEVLYVAGRNGTIAAVHAVGSATDKAPILWQRQMAKGILTEPVPTGKMLVVASLDGLYAFEAYFQNESNYSIGNLLWQFNLPGLVSTPAIDRGLIYIGSEDKNLYALEYGAQNVSIYWEYKTRGSIRVKPYISQRGSFVLFGSHDGNVYALDRKTSKLLWPRFIGAAVSGNIVSRVEGHNEFFYVGADNGGFYCINGQGDIVWEFHANGKIRCEPLIYGDRIYFGSQDNQLYCLDINTGKKIWQFSTDGNINGKPIIVGERIFFASEDSFVYGVQI